MNDKLNIGVGDSIIDTNRGTDRKIVEVHAGSHIGVESGKRGRKPSIIAWKNVKRYRVQRRRIPVPPLNAQELAPRNAIGRRPS